MAGELVFYTNPMSRGQIARWMLEEAGAPYETRYLRYGEEMNTPEYLALNPMGKVPTLVHDGHVVTECAAICAYLAETFPEAGLAPKPEERAAYYRALFFAAGPVEAAVVDRAIGAAPSADHEAMAGYGNYDRMLKGLKHLIEGRDFVCGDRFTAADVYFGSQVIWGMDFGSLPTDPVLVAYKERLTARPAYVRGKEKDMAAMADYAPAMPGS